MAPRTRPEPVPLASERAATADAKSAAAGRALDAQIHERAAQSGVADWAAMEQELDPAVDSFIVHALQALGWTWTPGSEWAAPTVARDLGVAPQFGRLFDHYLSLLAAHGLVVRAGGSRVSRARPCRWPMRGRGARRSSAGIHDSLTRLDLPPAAGLISPRCSPGGATRSICCSPGGSAEAAESLYRHSGAAHLFNGLAAEMLTTASPANSRPLRVVEFGGGTGGTTTYLLPALAERLEVRLHGCVAGLRASRAGPFRNRPAFSRDGRRHRARPRQPGPVGPLRRGSVCQRRACQRGSRADPDTRWLRARTRRSAASGGSAAPAGVD